MLPFVLAPNERVIRILRRAAAGVLPSLGLGLVAVALPWMYLKDFTLPTFLSIIWKIWLLAWVLWIVWRFWRWRLERYFITTERLVVVSHPHPFEQQVEDTSLDRVLNVGIERKGLVDMLFGLGTVLVHAVGLEDPLRLRHVMRPAKISRFIWQEHEKSLRRSREKQLEIAEGLRRKRRAQYVE